MKIIIPRHIKLFIQIYALSSFVFFIFRSIMLFLNFSNVNVIEEDKFLLLAQAFLMGLRFDVVVAGYILVLPFFLFSIAELFTSTYKWIYKLILSLISLLFALSFFVSAADLPYFTHFNAHLTTAAFLWMDSTDFMLEMVVSEWRYYFALLPLAALIAIFNFVLIRLYKNFILLENNFKFKYIAIPVLSIISLLLIILGIRGRLAEKSPIVAGTAYFSNYSFINQLGLNPNFTLIKSILEDSKNKEFKLSLMDDNLAVLEARRYLKIKGTYDSLYPFKRYEENSNLIGKKNVVLVLMESMSGYKTKFLGNNFLTPNLDNLAEKSISFSRMYSSGIHTNNGIFATLFSYPSLYKQHSLRYITIPSYEGLPSVMQENGYYNLYFTTHDEQFDNVGGFLSENKIREIVAEKDYKSDQKVSNLGIPDHILFDYTIEKLNDVSKRGKAFFATVMTASDHGPYTLPKGIALKAKSNNLKDQLAEYADWSIGQFLMKVEKCDWYQNTVFVFIADHGANSPTNYEMPISYHHIPFLIFDPQNPKKQVIDKLAVQVDLTPTVLSYLGYSWTNNTLGINLFNQDREYAYFTADEKLGVVDTSHIYIESNGNRFLYNFAKNSTINESISQKAKADSMQKYAYTMLQSAFWVNKKKLKR